MATRRLQLLTLLVEVRGTVLLGAAAAAGEVLTIDRSR